MQRELQGELLHEEPGQEDEKRRTSKLRRRAKGERSVEKASGLERAGEAEAVQRLELTVEEEEVKRAFLKLQLERRGNEEAEAGRKSRGAGRRGEKKRKRGEKIVLKSKDIKQFMQRKKKQKTVEQHHELEEEEEKHKKVHENLRNLHAFIQKGLSKRRRRPEHDEEGVRMRPDEDCQRVLTALQRRPRLDKHSASSHALPKASAKAVSAAAQSKSHGLSRRTNALSFSHSQSVGNLRGVATAHHSKPRKEKSSDFRDLRESHEAKSILKRAD